MIRALVFAAAALLATAAHAGQRAADLSGIWVLDPAESVTFNRDPAEPPPLRAEFAAAYQARRDWKPGTRHADPTAACLPLGMPRALYTRFPFQILQKPDQVTFVFQTGMRVRRVFMDGRTYDPELDPSFNGQAVGRWDGASLVVETQGLREDTWIDPTGVPHSPQLRVTERFRRTGADRLELEITLEDPVGLTRPWTTRKTYRLKPDADLTYDLCQDRAATNPRWASSEP